ncbi:energy-coupling factor ABC transporter permease [Aquisalimonas sp.]|uniref:energy-coupling factor ABC transporter permease n=1 Tax=Aquisalimonas sp. TaxID=1872621 RepID=UPI0025C2D4F6|nr:energy-coupling factor ABC transporter permease [Aquisalimonas sp.]
MNVDPSLLPAFVVWLSWPFYIAALVPALRAAPWPVLKANRLESLFIGGIACVAISWSMNAGIHPGLELHLLGATALTLIFGLSFAIVAASAALAAVSSIGVYDWQAFAMNGLLLAVLPALITHWIGLQAYKRLPHNFFVYIFVVAFLGAMLAVGVVILVSGVLLLALDAYPAAIVLYDYLAIMPLIMFPEGFLTGMIITILVVLRPQWVRTFDDRDYIHGK